MRYFSFLIISFFYFSTYSQDTNNTREHVSGLISRIAFGSCGHQDKPQPILSVAADENPDVFIFLGDNVYGDTDNMQVLRKNMICWATTTNSKSCEIQHNF